MAFRKAGILATVLAVCVSVSACGGDSTPPVVASDPPPAPLPPPPPPPPPPSVPAPSQSNVFPADARIIDMVQLGADPTGQEDATAIIQAAIDTYGEKQFGRWTLYFPNGTYRVEDTLVSGRFLAFRGESADGAVIRLADWADGFQDPQAPKPILQLGRTVNESFGVFVDDLTVANGSGNPGAVALDYQAHNLGAIRDVRLVSEDGAGVAGLMLKRRNANGVELTPGPHLVKNLAVDGFDTGVVLGEQQSGILNVTFEHIELEGQTIAGMAFTPRLNASIRGLLSRNDVPAITADRSFGAAFIVMDSTLETLGESSTRAAVELANDSNRIHFRNVETSGYASGILVGTTAVAETSFADWSSHDPESLFESPDTPIGLAVEETPDYTNTDIDTDWEAVDVDVQAAMDSGKPVIYLPNKGGEDFNVFNGITDTVTIPSSVRWVNAMDQVIGSGSWQGGDNPVFLIEGDRSDPPLIIERMEYQNQARFEGPFFQHTGSRTVVFKSTKGRYTAEPGAGDVFFEDHVGLDFVFRPGQKVWARQLNLEDNRAGERPLILNDGADLWMLGYKTEGAKTVLRGENGSRTDIYGGLYLPLRQGSVRDIPMYDIEDAGLSATGYTAFSTFPLHLRETRGGETRELTKDARASIALLSAYSAD